MQGKLSNYRIDVGPASQTVLNNKITLCKQIVCWAFNYGKIYSAVFGFTSSLCVSQQTQEIDPMLI